MKKDAWIGYLLVTPAVLLFIVIGLVSVIMSLVLSFYHLSMGSLLTQAVFTGFGNFKGFLLGKDPILSEFFWRAMGHNLIIGICMLVFIIPISLFIAVLLQEIKWGVAFFRTVFLLPMVTASVSIYYVWIGIYDPNGSLNQLLNSLGLQHFAEANGWLGDTKTALPAIIFMIILGGIPNTMILYFAGLQTIDPSLHEAAKIDGAGYWKRMIHITWPILRPISVIAVILLLNGAFQVFEPVWLTTKGGPAGASEVVNNLIFNEAFMGGTTGGMSDMGMANAMSWVVAAITFMFTLLSLRLFRDRT